MNQFCSPQSLAALLHSLPAVKESVQDYNSWMITLPFNKEIQDFTNSLRKRQYGWMLGLRALPMHLSELPASPKMQDINAADHSELN